MNYVIGILLLRDLEKGGSDYMSRKIDMMLLCTDAQLILKTLDCLIITLLPLHFLKQHIPELLASGPECHF